MKINLKNDAGAIKEASIGFAIDIAVLGPIIYLWRKKFMLAILTCIPGVSVGMAFVANEIHIKELLSQGFKPADNQSKEILLKKKIINEDGTFNASISFNKKIVVFVCAILANIILQHKNDTPTVKIDLNTAAETVDVDKLNNTLLRGTELQQKEIMKQSKNGVLETYIHIENVESAYGDCVRIKSFDTLAYQTIFKTNSVVCPTEKVTKDVLIDLQKGHSVKIKGVITGFDTYTHVDDNLNIKDRYIVKMNPAIITEIVK